MLIEFPGRTVVVTGGAHGFGRAIARGFAERGARVWICDIEAGELAEADAGITARAVDVGDSRAVNRLVEEVGAVDILVNNAGGVRGQVGRPVEEISDDDWRVIFAANVDGAFNFSRAVAPTMKQRRRGRIVNISSGAGLQPSLTGIQAYCSAKHAVVGLTRQLAHELGAWNITVNSVAPGFVRTNAATERQWASYGEAGQKALVERIAMKRLGTADDIANAVLFLASDYAGWITGQVLQVDGGK